jgi:nitrogen-specific signal transduction histidine kinase
LVFTETGRPEGTGLGLSTVRETAKPHAGGVRLTPSPSGTRFGLSMPWQPS